MFAYILQYTAKCMHPVYQNVSSFQVVNKGFHCVHERNEGNHEDVIMPQALYSEGRKILLLHLDRLHSDTLRRQMLCAALEKYQPAESMPLGCMMPEDI